MSEAKMGRGKIEIKRIENTTSRQVTFSKRRNGIIKKAQELSVLCDAKVSIIIISNSSTKRVYDYTTPGVSLKEMYDEYQRAEGIDVWHKQNQQMQEEERKLIEVNSMLRRDISQRIGGNHEELDLTELYNLECEMEQALVEIRNRKEHVITKRTHNLQKKVRGLEQMKRHLMLELETRFRAQEFGLADSNDNGGEYEDAAAYANTGVAADFLSMSNHHPFQYNLQQHGDSLGYRNLHDLRLA
ncbi:MADS-box protein CMB2-like [Amaranthus tricolor]|uniref:MADS-box protein CMB2-like n=1 Tax=Amaranthus tricolor TaxID=29722 RepID=UPI002583ADB1|nr:MADS-box protein CMB2-like [Amaranthus tricolor]